MPVTENLGSSSKHSRARGGEVESPPTEAVASSHRRPPWPFSWKPVQTAQPREKSGNGESVERKKQKLQVERKGFGPQWGDVHLSGNFSLQ